MVLPVVKYGDPVLRKKGRPVEKVTPEIQALIADMIETMSAARGVGLAAQQVGHALLLAVLDVRKAEDRPSTLEIDGKPADLDAHMPMVLLNPAVKPVNAPVAGPEGCLSFPEIYTDITRPETVDVRALDPEGRVIEFRAGGLLGRAVQHELDHLNGILFIDRMTQEDRDDLRPKLDKLQAATKSALKKSKGGR
jgi:peptide deformylase